MSPGTTSILMILMWVSDSWWAHNRCCVDSDCRVGHDHLLPRGNLSVKRVVPSLRKSRQLKNLENQYCQTKIVVGGIYICWVQIWPLFYVDYASDYLLTRTFGGFTIFQKQLGKTRQSNLPELLPHLVKFNDISAYLCYIASNWTIYLFLHVF